MEKHAVLIVGRGKLAQELLDGLRSQTVSMVAPWEDRDAVRGQRVFVVHAGSGRELGDAVKFCSVTGSVLLDLSTAGSQLPEAPDFPLVVCPNVNMQMLGFMAMVRQGLSISGAGTSALPNPTKHPKAPDPARPSTWRIHWMSRKKKSDRKGTRKRKARCLRSLPHTSQGTPSTKS